MLCKGILPNVHILMFLKSHNCLPFAIFHFKAVVLPPSTAYKKSHVLPLDVKNEFIMMRGFKLQEWMMWCGGALDADTLGHILGELLFISSRISTVNLSVPPHQRGAAIPKLSCW